jgi:hypothetical protein
LRKKRIEIANRNIVRNRVRKNRIQIEFEIELEKIDRNRVRKNGIEIELEKIEIKKIDFENSKEKIAI